MLLQNVPQDIAYGVRQLRRDPLFTLTAVLTLAIGIGANTTAFTLANALLFRDPVGVATPYRLIDIGFSFKGRGFGSGSYPDYLDIVRRATTLEGVYGHPRFPHAMSIGNERVFGMEISPNFFSVLGAVPSAGRLLVPGDAEAAVLSYRFWTRRFNRDTGVIGQTLRLNGKPFIVVALGAKRSDVVGMVLRQGMSLVAIGTAAGLILAAYASQVLAVLLFGIPPLDPVVFSGAAALFALTGLAACYMPARRATQIDPMKAVREE